MKSIFKSLLTTAIGTLMCSYTHSAVLPETPNDPVLAELFLKAQSLLRLVQTPGYMDMPNTLKPWPCKVDELYLRRIVGALSDDEQNEQFQKEKKLRTINLGTKMDARVISVKFAPVSANCINDSLDGRVEFFVEYTRVISVNGSDSELFTRVRSSLEMSSGKVKDNVLNQYLALNYIPKTAKTANPQANVSVVLNEFTRFMVDMNQFRFGDTAPWQTGTTFVSPVGKNKLLFRSYTDSKPSMMMNIKNNLPHGEWKNYAFIMDGKVVVPEKISCYENGEQLMTSNCDVD